MLVGAMLGKLEGTEDGALLGNRLGDFVEGDLVVGAVVGDAEGANVGEVVGFLVGATVGERVGLVVGDPVGVFEGKTLGE